MSSAAIILAAGFSRRLGRPKQTLILNGETLVERAAQTAREAGLTPVIVVLNPEGDYGHSLQQQGCLIVLNETAAEGMATSIVRGVRVAQTLKASGAVLMTCDQPAVTAAHLRALAADASTATGSAYAGKIGIPAYFPEAAFKDLLQLEGDTGARVLLRNARSIPTENLSFDIDTEEDLARARATFEGKI